MKAEEKIRGTNPAESNAGKPKSPEVGGDSGVEIEPRWDSVAEVPRDETNFKPTAPEKQRRRRRRGIMNTEMKSNSTQPQNGDLRETQHQKRIAKRNLG